MKRIGIFYGSTTGTTREIAHRIAKVLNVAEADIHDVASSAPSDVADYDTLILGTSTWGDGELQDDWADFIDGLEELALPDKEVALFGDGDETMSDTFCNAVGELHRRLEKTSAKFIAPFNVIGYTFDHSSAVMDDGEAYGLLLDEVNHPQMTDGRIEAWTKLIAQS